MVDNQTSTQTSEDEMIAETDVNNKEISATNEPESPLNQELANEAQELGAAEKDDDKADHKEEKRKYLKSLPRYVEKKNQSFDEVLDDFISIQNDNLIDKETLRVKAAMGIIPQYYNRLWIRQSNYLFRCLAALSHRRKKMKQNDK